MFFQTNKNPAATLRVPDWLWNLCIRLSGSKELLMRSASAGFIVNRLIVNDPEGRLHAAAEEVFETWTEALTSDELDDLEVSIALQVCHMVEWLSRLKRDRFPETELVAFACAREITEAASCALEWRNRASSIREDLNRLDHLVSAAIVDYSDPTNESERNIFMSRSAPLLKLARDRGALCWWGELAGKSP